MLFASSCFSPHRGKKTSKERLVRGPCKASGRVSQLPAVRNQFLQIRRQALLHALVPHHQHRPHRLAVEVPVVAQRAAMTFATLIANASVVAAKATEYESKNTIAIARNWLSIQ